MALFGFNKQKALNNAEKYVQQGKIQNAIAEYEKVLKNDAKDLTVTNTVGDLYSRLGETDKATVCFKTVGDAYASQGFTVKAIAMYKKICKLQPSLESLLKLAELYTQQGLFNDARSQYLQVAEEFLKAGELENAVRIFQKILEMDPENSNMRVRLAEVYVRLNKKTEAWQIFSAAAESLRSKGSLSAAEEILQRMLTLDPGNTYALLMQGKNMIESGDAARAVTTLQKVPDIDSNPEGLRDLLKAYLQTGQLSEAGSIAGKLLSVHNDLPAISSLADALMQAGQYENALQVFDQHAERLLAENSDKVLDSLHAIIGHVRDNPDSLQKLLDLFHKAGDTTHVSEVMELLAHASVQSGNLARARDLYQKLTAIEPANPLHLQNYQQVVSQLSGKSGNKLITPEEAVVLVEDLEATAPSVHQHYSDETSLAVRSALTDAELFISYNMPAKALGPLMGALPMAPDDLRINQRLAALHTRAARFAEAALCCRTLQRVYSDADYPEEATRYRELAERYEERTSIPAPGGSADAAVSLDAAPQVRVLEEHEQDHEPEAAVAEFAIEEASAEDITIDEEATPEEAAESQAASPWPTTAGHAAEITVEAAEEPEFTVAAESSAAAVEPAEASAEIDLSSEWDDTITVDADVPAEAEAEVEAASAVGASGVPESGKADETIDEIRFYVAHGMPAQAMAALAKLQTLTSDQGKLDELRAEVEAATQPAEEEAAAAAEPVIEELTADDIPTLEVETDETPVDDAPAAEAPVVEAPVAEAPKPPVAGEAPVAAKPPVKSKPAPVVHEPAPEPEPTVLNEFVSDLETSLGDGFVPGKAAKPAASPAAAATSAATPAVIIPAARQAVPAAHTEPAIAAEEPAPILGEFVADIEASLGEDFLKGAPVAATEPPAPVATALPHPTHRTPAPVVAPPVVVPPVVVPKVVAPKVTQPLAASAAASASAHQVAHSAPQSAPTMEAPAATASVSWHAPVVHAPRPQPPVSHPPSPAVAAKGSPFGDDAGVDLAEMFGELKHDLEADVAATDEDPETHYNLGIAFREMGLLDEAIGELQKACQSFDHGKPFPQIMQTYTWLAQCFLEKGVPEAAVRWYDKALKVPGIDGETRVALHYELASAYETSGDKTSALHHFMDVYGSNIDYRDVAERIKALKS
jgi:tetratricopeptide (TPR) repeat protein